MPYAEFIQQSEYILRIIVSGICGCMIGYERKNRNKEAGIRTHAIVALGAALMMIVSKYGFEDSMGFDASRVASQIVSGIGFLGAGIIFVRNHTVSGLTTAAGMWVTCGIGMSVGAGLYYVGSMATVIVVFMQVLMHSQSFLTREPDREIIQMTLKDTMDMSQLQEVFRKNKIQVLNIELKKKQPDQLKVNADVIFPSGISQLHLMEMLSGNPDVISTKCER